MSAGPPQGNSQQRYLSSSVERGLEESTTSSRFVEDVLSAMRDGDLKQVIADDDLLKALRS